MFGNVLQNFHFTFNPNELQLLCRSITVVEEQFLAGLNDAFGENTNSVVAIDHNHFCVTIWINGMIRESDFVSLACGVHNEIVVKIEQKTARILVIDFPAPISFILCNYLPAIFLWIKN